jgi:hypothetical protein
MRCLIAALVLLATPAAAQVVSGPTEPPVVTAENDTWYRQREPLPFAGDVYFPAGPTVFFDGNRMVRTGQYNGVPLYADTTIEPYSIVYVPVGGGLLQPYERVRSGDLAGSVGSRTPSFPVRSGPEPRGLPMAAISPASVPFVNTAADVNEEVATRRQPAREATPLSVGSLVATAVERVEGGGLETVRRAETNDGVWLQFMGERWVSAGPAVPLRAAEFVKVGDYGGFPVFARAGLQEERIYLPSAAGNVAPFRLKDRPVAR